MFAFLSQAVPSLEVVRKVSTARRTNTPLGFAQLLPETPAPLQREALLEPMCLPLSGRSPGGTTSFNKAVSEMQDNLRQVTRLC